MGLSKSGRKKLSLRNPKFTCAPTVIRPLPMIAPINPCVVETGNPVTAAKMTVRPVPTATAKTKYSEPTTASGTKPWPENFFNSDRARKMEQTEPPNVVTVAHPIAVL